MRRPCPALLVALLLTALTACALPDPPDGLDPLQGTWTVEAIEGTPVVTGPADDAAPSLTFLADGSLSGHTGVNGLRGTWTSDGMTLDVPPLATTKRAGPPVLMDQERHLLTVLQRLAAALVQGDQLILQDGDGQELLRLRAAGPR